MKVVFSHLNGNPNVRAALKGLLEADVLAKFYTTLATFKGTPLYKLGEISFLSDLKRREYDSRLKPYTEILPWLEIGRLVSSKAKIYSLTKEQSAIFNENNVAYNLDKHVASNLYQAQKLGVNAVYCYEDTALSTFKEAKKLGIKCIYDLPIGYWKTARELLKKEYDRWPEWVPTMVGLKDSEAKLQRKDEELKLADQILVASTFTASTLKDFSEKLAPVSIIPYGFPPAINSKEYKNTNSPLKVLFVGGLSQRKGIADLFTAVENIGKHVQLTVVGRKINNDCIPLNDALKKHKWYPSLPHSEILNLMKENDLFVFPSLFEGFGLVITEAMSQGTPVITTDRTAGPDVIENGKNGWIIKAGSTSALQEAIEKLLERRSDIAEAGYLATEAARKRTWELYSQEVARVISKSTI